jgi:hypothetical protein
MEYVTIDPLLIYEPIVFRRRVKEANIIIKEFVNIINAKEEALSGYGFRCEPPLPGRLAYTDVEGNNVYIDLCAKTDEDYDKYINDPVWQYIGPVYRLVYDSSSVWLNRITDVCNTTKPSIDEYKL